MQTPEQVNARWAELVTDYAKRRLKSKRIAEFDCNESGVDHDHRQKAMCSGCSRGRNVTDCWDVCQWFRANENGYCVNWRMK